VIVDVTPVTRGPAADRAGDTMSKGLRRFVVERRVPEMSSEELLDLHAAVEDATHRLTVDSSRVVCMRTLYLPATKRWIAVFEADALDTVKRAARIAQLPPGDVREAIELAGGG
jgi:hypothetical protein